MSLSRLSAGSGYRYLLRDTAAGDSVRPAGEPLAGYYAATGNPAGRWLGRGLAGLAADGVTSELKVGSVVTEEAMATLYGEGRHPMTGEPLGRPYPRFRTAGERIAAAVEGLPACLPAPARLTAVAAIEARVAASPSRHAVAGFDLTFTVPKSASVLWALGDEHVQAAVVESHREAVAAVLGLIEDRYLFTRTGKGSTVQVATRGMVAAAFDHWDSRAGDPNLHTHAVLANKVQGLDGKWRAVDAQVLFQAAVACSEVYDDLLADALAARLPVTWSHRDRGPRRTPAFEIDGVDDALLKAFSQRSLAIASALADMLATTEPAYEPESSRTAAIRARQRATLATRPAKHVRSLSELRAQWRDIAHRVTGDCPQALVERATRPRLRQRIHVDAVPPQIIDRLAIAVVAGLQERRSTWTRANVLAESARATRHLRMRSTGDRLALLDWVAAATLARCVPLDPPAVDSAPTRFHRPEVASRPHEHAFTTEAVLADEAKLLAGVEALDAPTVSAELVEFVLTAPRMPGAGRPLAEDQAEAVRRLATSGRRVEVLVGPAGSGKTRTLHALRATWTLGHGAESMIGLAPSAAAAAQLAAALGVPCATLAKWRHSAQDTTGAGLRLPAGGLVVLDEASLAATTDLHALVVAATAVDAKVVLVGDHHQLGAVGAGGAFALLADTGHAIELRSLWRFAHQWEADATRRLRDGDPAALDAYERHGRIDGGSTTAMLDAAYRAWHADVAGGLTSVLIAPDNTAVAALNARAQADRVSAGTVHPTGVDIADGAHAATGDVIVTRRNDRRLRLADGEHVRNGTLWRVAETYPDGSLDACPVSESFNPGEHPAEAMRLPATYVRDHVELGYATTVHRAQGLTVDTAHALVGARTTRQAFYVAMSRGRQANSSYVVTDVQDQPDATHRQLLEHVLANDGNERSATATLRRRSVSPAAAERALHHINEGLRGRTSTRPSATAANGTQRQHPSRPAPTITPGG